MPERIISNPGKSQGEKSEEEAISLIDKKDVSKHAPSFFMLYQYASLYDYILVSSGVAFAIVFSILPVRFIDGIGDLIEIAGTSRFDLPKFYDKQHELGMNLLEMGLVTMCLCWTAFIIVGKLGANLSRKWKSAYFAAVIYKPASWHEKNYHSSLIENMEKDCMLIHTSVGEKPLLIISAISFYVCCWIQSLQIHHGLTMVAAVMIPFQLIAAFLLERASVKNASEAHNEAVPIVDSTIDSMKFIRNSNAQDKPLQEYNQKAEGMTTRTSIMGTLHGFGLAMFFVVLYSFSAGLFYMISQILLKEPDWWIGDTIVMPREAVSIFIATSMSSFYLGWIAPSLRHILLGMDAAARMDLVIKKNEKEDGFKRIVQMNGKLEIKNVGFRKLDRINLVVEAGQCVGIAGCKGSGKTSLTQIISGTRYCDSGEICIDGVDIKKLLLSDLRECLAIVPEKPVIFAGNFRENLTLGIVRSDKELVIAAEMAGIDGFINSCGGYLSAIPDLSKIQKHQISLARAILKDPKILLIDDIFSSIPNLTSEQQVELKNFAHSISNCIKNRTAIILSKSILLLDLAGEIAVLESGYLQEPMSQEDFTNHPTCIKLSMAEKSFTSTPQRNTIVVGPCSNAEIISRLARSEARYWYWLLPVLVSGILAGVTFPIFGYFFADNVATLLYLHGAFDKSKIKEDMVDRIMESVLILIAVTLLCCSLGRVAALHTRDIRKKLMAALLDCPTYNFSTSSYSKDNVKAAMGDDSERVGNLAGSVLGILILVSSALGGAIYYSFISDKPLTIIVVCAVPVIIFVTLAAESVVSSTITPLIPTCSKVLENTAVIQNYNRQGYYHDEYMISASNSEQTADRYACVNALFVAGKFLILFGFWSIIALYSASKVKDGDLALDDMFIVCFCMLFCFSSFVVVGALMPDIPAGIQSARNIFYILDSAHAYPTNPTGRKTEIIGELEFKFVLFSYPRNESYALADVSFSVSPRNVISIIGCGEAIADLLLRHYQTDSGEILIDASPISEYCLASIRSAIAYVSSKPLIFAGSLRENLDLARHCTDQEFADVCARFELKDTANWNEREKKNLEIARCMLKKPKIVIADEDSNHLKGDWALILLSLCPRSQDGEIVLLEQGVVIAKGSHSQLMKRPDGIYKALISAN